jgi:hypothetical protein
MVIARVLFPLPIYEGSAIHPINGSSWPSIYFLNQTADSFGELATSHIEPAATAAISGR